MGKTKAIQTKIGVKEKRFQVEERKTRKMNSGKLRSTVRNIRDIFLFLTSGKQSSLNINLVFKRGGRRAVRLCSEMDRAVLFHLGNEAVTGQVILLVRLLLIGFLQRVEAHLPLPPGAWLGA